MRWLMARIATAACCLLLTGPLAAQVYKVVDEDGNVTYTDTPPPDGSGPMNLPELSVVETEKVEPVELESDTGAAAENQEPTPRELRRMFSDFRITNPAPEETFWGTQNTVVASWGSSQPMLPGMTVRVFVDGKQFGDSQQGVMALTLDRGEHTVSAQLLDARGRRVATADPVTFFVKQYSANFNRPTPAPQGGN